MMRTFPNPVFLGIVVYSSVILNHETVKCQYYSTSSSVRIVLVGRGESEISSTLRELIGPATNCDKPEGSEALQNIYEYTLTSKPEQSGSYPIQLVHIPGLVDDRTLAQDSQILASLKSYLAKVGQPDYFLVISGIDEDDRNSDIASPFEHLLKRIELFKSKFLENSLGWKMNAVFLLTRFMRLTKMEQRKPSEIIQKLWRVIEEHSSFSCISSCIVVGDNEAESLGATVENGYYNFLNKEQYPKNVWEGLINSISTLGMTDAIRKAKVLQALNKIKDNREVGMNCSVKLVQTNWDEYESDVDAFRYLLGRQNVTVENSEVNLDIDGVFNRVPLKQYKVKCAVQKTALQLFLQNEQILESGDLPIGFLDRVGFFHKSSLISSIYPASLLDGGFGLKMPEYLDPLLVGYGYDVMADKVTESSFKTDKYLPSSVGFRIPYFMKCRKLPVPKIQIFQRYLGNNLEHFLERLKYLKFGSTETIGISMGNFTPSIKDGFNTAPGNESGVATLTAVKEVRTMECVLSKEIASLELTAEFIQKVSALPPVNVSSIDSVTKWKSFFGKYGTHMIVQGYGGGILTGSVAGTKVKAFLESRNQSEIVEVLNAILRFSKRPIFVTELNKPSYKFGNKKIPQFYDMPKSQRDDMLVEWAGSLNLNFVMLKSELSLERISNIVKTKMGSHRASMIDAAINLTLKGELEHDRANGNSPNNRINLHVLVDGKNVTVTDTRMMTNDKIRSTLHSIYNQTETERRTGQSMIDRFRRMEEEQEARHREFIDELESRRDDECRLPIMALLNPRCYHLRLHNTHGFSLQ